jgi:hypothetical protein
MVVLDGNFALDCNGLPLYTYISMYVRTNRCYNERGSRTNYVRSNIPHYIMGDGKKKRVQISTWLPVRSTDGNCVVACTTLKA